MQMKCNKCGKEIFEVYYDGKKIIAESWGGGVGWIGHTCKLK